MTARYSQAWSNFIRDLLVDSDKRQTALDLYTKVEPAYTLENDYDPNGDIKRKNVIHYGYPVYPVMNQVY